MSGELVGKSDHSPLFFAVIAVAAGVSIGAYKAGRNAGYSTPTVLAAIAAAWGLGWESGGSDE